MSASTPTPGQEPAEHLPAPQIAAEVAPARRVVPSPDGITVLPPSGMVVSVQPTQVRRPWRATVRTIVQAAVALAVLFPVLVQTAGLDPDSFPWLGGALLVAAAVARVMALPQLEAFLRRFAPWLAAGGQ